MKRLIAQLIATLCVLLALIPTANAGWVTTKEVQIVVSFVNPDLFAYFSQNGNVITSDLTVTNPPGSTYVFLGGLFPAGTVDLNQHTYTKDHNGNPLTGENSIGTWLCTGTRLIRWNLSGVDFPAQGTVVEEMNWTFLLKNPTGPSTEIHSKGWFRAGQPGTGPDVVVGRALLDILGGTAQNAGIEGEIQSEVYLSPDGLASLTVLKLSTPIKIFVPKGG